VSIKQNHPKARSISCIFTEVLSYHSGPRQGPGTLGIDVTSIIQASKEIAVPARVVDFGWVLCRMPIEDTLFSFTDSQRQLIPVWTGFNIQQNFPQFIQCCRDLYKLLTNSDNMMSLLFSIKRSTPLRCCGRTRISFRDWLSGLALFTPSVPCCYWQTIWRCRACATTELDTRIRYTHSLLMM